MEQWFAWMGVGFLIGTIGTIIGAGGGFLLVPLLLITRPEFSPEQTTAISMAVVAANALSGSLAYARSKRIDFKAGFVFALATIPGSVIGAFLTSYIPQRVFSVAFGILLTVLAAYLFFKQRHEHETQETVQHKEGPGWRRHELTDAAGLHFSYSYNQTYGILISVLVGFISPILGIGGGIIHVPAMVQLLRFPLYIATATSHFVLAIMATITVAVHIWNGVYNDREVATLVFALAAGVIPGAVTGASISHHIPTKVIVRVMAVCLALVGFRILLRH